MRAHINASGISTPAYAPRAHPIRRKKEKRRYEHRENIRESRASWCIEHNAHKRYGRKYGASKKASARAHLRANLTSQAKRVQIKHRMAPSCTRSKHATRRAMTERARVEESISVASERNKAASNKPDSKVGERRHRQERWRKERR